MKTLENTSGTSLHTPGPWTYGGLRESNIEPMHHQISASHDDNGPVRKKVATVYYGESDAEREANARLIAAAPLLLSALEPFIQLCIELSVSLTAEQTSESINKLAAHCHAARNAIAAAKGGLSA